MATGDPITSAEVNEAIRAVLERGEAYTLKDGTEVRSANIDKLYDLLREVQTREASAAGGAGIFRPIGFGRAT